MKILKVHFQNLNSLEGEWEIDFGDPAYSFNSIFAITGPTGSGKTTLLDAICLALYGRTPRLKTISKSVNEVLTRRTGACFSEVTFETIKGCFRCHWSQHRARKNPDGDLQQPRHEIIDNTNDRILENRIKDVARIVEEVTGMTFDQFTRSILLAQGNFAAFLQAHPDERAPILEQITGTDIYSRISQKVHERCSLEEKSYRTMAEEIKGFTLLSQDEEKAVRQQLMDEQQNVQVLEHNFKSLQEQIKWHQSIANLRQETAALEKEAQVIARSQEKHLATRQLLKKARLASQLIPVFEQLDQLKKTQAEEIKENQRLKDQLPVLETTKNEESKKLTHLEEKVAENKNTLERERSVCKTVRALDLQIQELHSQLQKQKKVLDNLTKQRDIAKHLRSKGRQEKERTALQLDECEVYLHNNRHDGHLVENLTGLREKSHHIDRVRKNLEMLSTELQECSSKLQAEKKRAGRLKDRLAKSSSFFAEARNNHLELAAKREAIREQYPSLRKQIEKCTERVQYSDSLRSSVEQAGILLKQLEDAIATANNLQREIVTIQKEEAQLKEKLELQQKIVDQQENLVAQTLRIQSLEKEREKLEPGQPCPLCGSADHPFASTLFDHPDDAKSLLYKERSRHSQIREKLHTTQTRGTLKLAQRNDNDKLLLQLDKSIAENEQKTADICRQINIAPESISLESLEQMLQEMRTQKDLLTETADQLDRFDADYASSLNAIEKAKEETISLEKDLTQAQFDLSRTTSQREELHSRQQQLKQSLDETWSNFESEVKPYGIAETAVDTAAIIDSLKTRQQQWKKNQNKREQLQLQLNHIDSELRQHQTLITKLKADITLHKVDREQLAASHADKKLERKRLYADKDPDQQEKQLEDALSLLEKHKTETIEQLQNINRQSALVTDRLDRLHKSTTTRGKQLALEEKNALHQLSNNDFKDMAEFRSAILSEERIAQYDNQLKKLDSQQTQNSALLADKHRMLELELSKCLTTQDLPALQHNSDVVRNNLNEKNQFIGRLHAKIEENDRTLQLQQHKLKKLAGQQREFDKWQKLNTLIGSSSGKKFRNFAQGITFELMVAHANISLQKMTDRYILLRDTQYPLELSIVDNYRAGDIRSTKNLSGGESFLVSLALALGLSNMAGKSVRVDSLFLDEGFGTLDEETLETALQALAGLQHEGKTIGIISHVSLLKERLATQIELIPARGGHSTMKGPGVRSL